MKITNVTTFVVKVAKAAYLGGQTQEAIGEQRGDYVTNRHYRSKYSVNTETMFVKLDTDAGLVGWGEAQAPLVPEAAGALAHRLIGPYLLGRDPFDVDVLWNDAYDGMRERGHGGGFMLDAIAACDIALWDLMGKAVDKPVHKLLGGRFRERVRSYVSGVPGPAPEDRARYAAGWRAKGYDAFKMALGYGHDADAAAFEAVRDAVGPAADLMIDAHWRYSVSEAITLGRTLERSGLYFFEAPIAPENAPGQAAVARALDAPVAIGEELRTRFEYRERLTIGALDIAQPDVGRMGITELRKVAALCETFDVPVALHLGVGLGVYMAASVQVAAAIPNFLIIEFQPNQFEVANRLLLEPIVNEAGAYDVPEAPGLGVAPDENAIREHATEVWTLA